jgi:hypothetical protein
MIDRAAAPEKEVSQGMQPKKRGRKKGAEEEEFGKRRRECIV